MTKKTHNFWDKSLKLWKKSAISRHVNLCQNVAKIWYFPTKNVILNEIVKGLWHLSAYDKSSDCSKEKVSLLQHFLNTKILFLITKTTKNTITWGKKNFTLTGNCFPETSNVRINHLFKLRGDLKMPFYLRDGVEGPRSLQVYCRPGKVKTFASNVLLFCHKFPRPDPVLWKQKPSDLWQHSSKQEGHPCTNSHFYALFVHIQS